jgi:hypothetical protein
MTDSIWVYIIQVAFGILVIFLNKPFAKIACKQQERLGVHIDEKDILNTRILAVAVGTGVVLLGLFELYVKYWQFR